MTGFGKATAEVNCKKITVEVKSLNSKQMDLSARIPSSLRGYEIELRNTVAHELQRGKVDINVSCEALAGAPAPVRLNMSALTQYRKDLDAAAAALGIELAAADIMPLLMRFPDVMVTDGDEDNSPEIALALTDTCRKAVEAVTAHRRAEGERLESFFETRVRAIGELLESIAPYEAERVPRIRERIEEGLARIPVAEYDKGRLEQEMIFYIEKLDVNEERQRLAQHLRYFIETMNGEPGQGKKLGFIAQEMGREINTLGSKSNHADMQRIVVKMKNILEQIKEQVLNVL